MTETEIGEQLLRAMHALSKVLEASDSDGIQIDVRFVDDKVDFEVRSDSEDVMRAAERVFAFIETFKERRSRAKAKS